MADQKRIRDIKSRLEKTDLLLVRTIEDIIRILVQRGLIKYSDLCDESRELIGEREELREELRVLSESGRQED
ncbi:MAG TPA: hypothetical protein VMJ66_12550 [Geobacteraceae bacterium]|nr:hypothetical protein [Geobacteraceae bacterium]